MDSLERRTLAQRTYRRLLHLMQDFQGLGFDLDPESTSLGAMLVTAREEADDAGYAYERYHLSPR